MSLLRKVLPVRKRVETDCFGMIAEFPDDQQLLAAIGRCREAGFEKLEAYTPVPIHEVWEALGHKSPLPFLVLCGGITGAIAGFALQYWASVHYYPMNIGGRPLNSWPSFFIITFEMTILFASLTAVFGMLALNGLPRPHHPVFEIPEFDLASRNRFFLLVMAHDPMFERETASRILNELSPLSLKEVPNP